MRLRNLAALPFLAAALALPAATASASGSIVITDAGGALVTTAQVRTGEELAHDGIAYTVEFTLCRDGICELTLAPRLPAQDSGKSLVFAVLS